MKPAVCFTVASTLTYNAFLTGHLRALRKHFRVTVLANLDPASPPPTALDDVVIKAIPIAREISPLRDLAALWLLWREFLRGGYVCVHSVSPKAGLLAMLASRVAGVPVRVHTFTGQIWATRHGFRRILFKTLDRLLARCATHVFADSASQRDFLVIQTIVAPEKIRVLGAGSISGVDTFRFKPDADARRQVRAGMGIGDASLLLLFVGRLKREKGIPELLAAFARLRQGHAGVELVLVGPDEEGLLTESSHPHVHTVGYSDHVERYMAAADMVFLPSHREGFGSVLIEAAACGVPAVASRIYGVTDAVVDGVTGLLHPPGDSDSLHDAMHRLAADPQARRRMGTAARERALAHFDARRVTASWVDFYKQHVAPQARPLA